jgi:hypothetical protein
MSFSIKGKTKNEHVSRKTFQRKDVHIMAKNKQDKTKSVLSSMQEVTYAKEFKAADRAGGYTRKNNK